MPTATEQIATFLSVEGEPVEGEPWFWVAHYDDGSFLAQFDGATGRFHRFREIEASRLARFELRAAFSPALRFELPVRPGMRPIHFYRNTVLNAGTPDEVRVRVYCFGYQQTVGGRNVQTVLEIHPSGAVVVRDGKA